MWLPQSYRYPNISEGADSVAGQLRGDKECPSSGVTKSGRVWRKVPESDGGSVGQSVGGRVGGSVGQSVGGRVGGSVSTGVVTSVLLWLT